MAKPNSQKNTDFGFLDPAMDMMLLNSTTPVRNRRAQQKMDKHLGTMSRHPGHISMAAARSRRILEASLAGTLGSGFENSTRPGMTSRATPPQTRPGVTG